MKKIIHFTLVLLFTFSFPGIQAQDPGKKMSQKEIALLIDSVSAALKHWYIYPDKAELMSNTVKANFKNGTYAKANNRIELSMQLHNDIQKVHTDKHLRVMYNPGFASDLMTHLPDSLEKKEHEKMLQAAKENNFAFVKTEILPANIGYIRWDGFDGHTQEAESIINSAFQFVANTKTLIIDMRYNGGGSPETVLATLNYFFDKKLPMNHIIDWHKDTLKQITDPSKTTFKLSMPVYVLTSKGTFSGAEDFTYCMKHTKRGIIIGDTTGGGAHPTGPCCLGQGFVMNVPLARSYNEITKTNWEGTGIPPDVAINSEEALYKTQMIIYKDLLEKAGDPEEKKLYQWHVQVAENKVAVAKQILTSGTQYTKEQLQKLCGEYVAKKPGPLPAHIIMKGNYIYRHVNLASVPDARLTPIGNNRFVYDDDSGRSIDFILDKDGNAISINLTRGDGVNMYDKVK